ncbi:hypothetical protein [Pedobacter caeni]|uniref:Uncharacterized protein n=1 Tax=Pedobacter caeni TaxID=288992 RepID=A0A1M5HSH9_9SPHI|nr:hypothetical protein [Pedobacter caeni]SHG18929.1 hypothetical protein SAMN04488522_104793 [Pedobacter caeni]
MTEQNKTQSVLEKIKSFAIGYIGAAIFAMGTTYFEAQSSYHVPRILSPIYDVFGNIGLAIGMVLLGAGLMYWAAKRFLKVQQGKAGLMIGILAFFIIANYGLIWLNNRDKPETPGTIAKKTEAAVQGAERPELDSPEANAYLDKMENLLITMQTAKKSNDATAIEKTEQQYGALIEELSTIIPVLSKTSTYRDFILYNANITGKINQLRGIK